MIVQNYDGIVQGQALLFAMFLERKQKARLDPQPFKLVHYLLAPVGDKMSPTGIQGKELSAEI